jgi:hypothetical protein
MSDGKTFIEKMRKEKGLICWSDPDLIGYIKEKNVIDPIEIVTIDPQKHEKCINLQGWFSIEELDALLIMLFNCRGEMRAS